VGFGQRLSYKCQTCEYFFCIDGIGEKRTTPQVRACLIILCKLTGRPSKAACRKKEQVIKRENRQFWQNLPWLRFTLV